VALTEVVGGTLLAIGFWLAQPRQS